MEPMSLLYYTASLFALVLGAINIYFIYLGCSSPGRSVFMERHPKFPMKTCEKKTEVLATHLHAEKGFTSSYIFVKTPPRFHPFPVFTSLPAGGQAG